MKIESVKDRVMTGPLNRPEGGEGVCQVNIYRRTIICRERGRFKGPKQEVF